MPNGWTNITARITSLAELKVVEYVLKHTWGYHEFGILKKITTDEFMHGRKRKDGTRIDLGTGLSNRSVIDGLRRAVEHGLLVEEVDDRDKARVKKSYALKMKPQPEPEEKPQEDPEAGNYLAVKNLHSGQKNLHRRGEDSTHRSEEDTLERQQQQEVVVNRLMDWKIERDRAEQLLRDHPAERIIEKIEILEWKLEAQPPGRPIEDPTGWLIRAIQKDYQPPSSFKTRAEREKEAEEQARLIAEQEAVYEEQKEAADRRQEEKLAELNRRYGTTQRELDLWKQALDSLQLQMPKATFEAWFPRTQLLSLDDTAALIGVPNQQTREWLDHRLSEKIQQTLAVIFGRSVEVTFEILDQAEGQA